MRTQRMSQRLLAWLLALVMALACAPQALAEDSAKASIMRLQKTEGTVSVTDGSGKSVSTWDGLRLYNGYRLVTEEASYAWVNLDDSKLVKEDAVSEISIRKSGRKLDILVDSGNLFFDVSRPLEDEESMNIRTSTMAVGIRGTCGWVKVIDQWTSVLYILEGAVTVMVTDPVTGETKSETVRAGETVTCKVYSQDKDGTKCDIIRQAFTEDVIEGFVLAELVQNRPLCEKIKEASGLDAAGLDAPQKLKEDQDAVHKKLEAVKGRLENQENNISRNPVWTTPAASGKPSSKDDDRDSGSSSGGGSSGGSGTPSTPAVNQELTMPQTDDTVNEYLSRSGVSGVTLLPGSARSSTINMLEVDSGITVPAGKTLTLRPGVRMEVLSGQTVALRANARVTIGGAFISAGNLTGDTGATVKAMGIESSVPLEDWKQSDAPDSAGYYTLTYSPQGVYTIKFNANGGTVSPAQTQTGRDSRLTALPTPTRTGYAFSGWFTEAEGGTAVTTETVFTQDTTIYAHWTAAGKIVITYDANGGTGSGTTTALIKISPTLTTVKWDEIPVPTREGYTFAGWYTEPTGGILLTTSYNVTASMTIYAHWTGGGAGNVTWRIVGTTLYIEGSGPMESMEGYTTSDANGVTVYTWPWYASVGTITRVEIESGITNIGPWAFNGCSKVTSVTIPSTVASVGYRAFQDCDALTSVTIPKGTIGELAFHSCDNLTNVVLSSGVTSIGMQAFLNCGSLSTIQLPSSLTSVGVNAFTQCTGLTAATYSGTEAQWNSKVTVSSGNDPLLNALRFTGGATPPGGETGSVTWRMEGTTLYIEGSGKMESVEGYNASASSEYDRWPWHSYNETIKTVVIENGITSIGTFAFYNYNKVTSVTIPDTVASIGPKAFYSCYMLPSVKIPDSVTSIGDSVFSLCSSLTSVTIPDGVTSIGDNTFSACTNLTSVTIPDTVASIGASVFTNCSQLASVKIPDRVTSIGDAAFFGCSGLASVKIPDGVTSIGTNVFHECRGLTSVTIPDSVTSIGYQAFYTCNNLKDVYYSGTQAQWGSISIGTNNTSLTNATIHYNSTTRSSVSYAAPPVYTDVPAGASYAEAVRYCKENGIMLGTTDATFSPDRTLTRAMMVTVLHRMAGKPAAAAPASFADVPAGRYYTDAVAWASAQGIVRGYDGVTFGPDDPVTHRQAGLIFQRYTGGGGVNIPGAEAPDAPATRAEIAVALMNCAKASSGRSAIDAMCAPSGIAQDQDGSLLVTDVYGKQLWRVRSRAGTVFAGGETVRDLYGQPMGGYNDARLTGSYFKEPWAIAPFLDGWAVSDAANNAVRLIAGKDVRTLNGATSEKLKTARLGVVFDRPTGLAADDSGSLYVADTGGGAVRKITAKGEVTTVAKDLAEPMGLCWKDGTLYIAEAGKNRIVTLAGGKVSVLAGNGGNGLVNGEAPEASFSAPQGLTVGDDGSVYVADTGNGAVRRIKDGTVTTVAAEGLTAPRGLLLQGGSLYVCDTFARKIVVCQLG